MSNVCLKVSKGMSIVRRMEATPTHNGDVPVKPVVRVSGLGCKGLDLNAFCEGLGFRL